MTALSEPKPVCRCGKVIEPFESPFTPGKMLWPDSCPDCRNEIEKARERKERSTRTDEILKQSNMPIAAREWTIERAAEKGIQGFHTGCYWRYSREGLYLWGPAGTGKTVLSWCLLRRELENGKTGLFLSVPKFLAELRRQTATGKYWSNAAETVEVLVLDDIGAERPTEWVRENLLMIINERSDNHRPIIYTSNHKPGELYKHLGDPTGRIADRVVGACRVIGFQGESFRLQAAKDRQKTLFGGNHE